MGKALVIGCAAMGENEAAAQVLAAQLGMEGIDSRVIGRGVHWQVEVGSSASRLLRVHCFWYDRALSGLVLGMNLANARRQPGRARATYEGPEYLVILHNGRMRIADGRTRDIADVVACARAWLAPVDLAQLVREVPFVDAKRRAMHAVAEQLEAGLRWEVGDDPSYELWVYNNDRSCKVWAGPHGTECSFLLGQAQVAYIPALHDVPAAVAAWLIARLPVNALATRVPGVELERHAQRLETDAARWHWLHVGDRINDPNDVLAPLADLMRALASSPIATRFYSYSSLNRLCFSASSHYPWVDEGLPVVTPTVGGAYLIGTALCELDAAVKLIEATLLASPVQPFFGSAPHHEHPLLSDCLERLGSDLRPQLIQHGAWYELTVVAAAGAKRCIVGARHVAFVDANGRLDASWPALEDGVRAICRYCDGNESLDEIARDPLAQHVSRRDAVVD